MSTGALLTIITGVPGTGKTALAVKMIMDFLEKNPERPVFVGGINGLQLPHLKLPPRNEWVEEFPHPDDASILAYRYTFPVGSLIVLDEAHDFFPVRSTGSKVPDYTAAMKTHRHFGLDFILMTQGPAFLDAEIRGLAGKYIHLRDHWSGRKLYEWAEVVDPKSASERARATTTSYKIPKEVFRQYKSSSMHVKRERRLPKQVWILIALVTVLSFLGWRIYGTISGAITGEKKYGQVAGSPASGTIEDGTRTQLAAPAGPSSVVPGASVEDYVPRLPQRPETAPLYDSIRSVRSMPVVAGCVAIRDRCACYTGQGTDAFLTDAQCRAWLDSPPFDPWRNPDSAPPPADVTTVDYQG